MHVNVQTGRWGSSQNSPLQDAFVQLLMCNVMRLSRDQRRLTIYTMVTVEIVRQLANCLATFMVLTDNNRSQTIPDNVTV